MPHTGSTGKGAQNPGERRKAQQAAAAAARARAQAEAQQHYRDVVQHEAGPGRGSVAPPSVPRTVPSDPAGAAARPFIRQTALVAAATNDTTDTARVYQQQIADQHAAAQELIQRANPDYDPTAARQYDMSHGAPGAPDVHHKDPTTLLLNSVGYTGNGIQDFNAQVSRINKVFNDVYGHDPTPGLILDLARSPEASDPAALRALLSGQQATNLLPRQAQLMHATSQNPMAGAQKLTEQKGLEAALRASLFGNNAQPLIAASAKLAANSQDKDLLARYQAGDHAATMQMASIMPGIDPKFVQSISDLNTKLKQYGYQPSDFAGKTWQQNQRIVADALGSAAGAGKVATARMGAGSKPQQVTAANTIALIADYQKKMNARYKLGLNVSGVIDDSWAKAITTLSHSHSYAMQIMSQNASNAGFGGTFDSFKAFDQNGQFTNTSDGRAAKEAIQTWLHAQHGQAKFINNYPLLQQFGVSMPLQWFNNGGLSAGAGLDWILGSDQGHWSWNPVALGGAVSDLTSIPGRAEHGLFRTGLSALDAMNGGWNQGKTWLYSTEALTGMDGVNPNNWHGSDPREAAKRLSESASWLNLEGMDKKFTDKNQKLDFVTNMIGDILVARKFGATGETMRVGEFNRAVNDAVQTHDLAYGRAVLGRSAYAQEQVDGVWTHGRSGDLGHAVEHFAGQGNSTSNMIAAEALDGRNWVKIEEGADNPWGEQFVMSDGTHLRPVTDAEEQALRANGNSRAMEHARYTNAKPDELFGPKGHFVQRQWAAISAATRDMSEEQALHAHAELRAELEGLGLNPLETNGIYGGEAERSLLVPGMTQDEARAFGERYGQESVLTPKGLMYTSGEHAGKYEPYASPISKVPEGQADNMSTTELGGVPTSYAGDFTFDPANFLPIDSEFMRSKPFGDITRGGFPPDAELYRHSELLKDDLISRETHENMMAYQVFARNRGLDSWKAPGVPARSTKFLQPMQRFWLKGHGPAFVPHPLAASKSHLWEATSHIFDWVDKTMEVDTNGRGGYLDRVARNLRTGFTKTPNPHAVPLIGADPRNIFRLALNAGLRSDKGMKIAGIEEGFPSAKALEKMFIRAHADNDPALALKVEERITQAAIAQGRNGAALDSGNAFSAYADAVGDPAYLMTQRAELEKMIKEELANQPAPAAAGSSAPLSRPDLEGALKKAPGIMGSAPSVRLVDGSVHALNSAQIGANGELMLQDGSFVDAGLVSGVYDHTGKAIAESAAAAPEESGVATAVAQSPRLQMLTDMLLRAKSSSSPLYESELKATTGVPAMLLPKQSAVGSLNNALKRMSLVQRELILMGDPILFSKHGLTDTIRRMIAEGPRRVITSRGARKRLAAYLADNPEDKAMFETMLSFTKNGEMRYDMEGWTHAVGKAHAFMSGEDPRAAADYIDRRLMSGAYQAYKVDGRDGVTKFFLDDPKGQALAEAEGFPGEESWFLAHMVGQNLDNIELHAPGFLEKAEQIRNTNTDPRKALAKYIKKNKVSFPVSGHLSNDAVFNLAQKFDAVAGKMIGAYLIPNKWNRGGLFHDMTAHLFQQYTKAGGSERDSLRAAMSQARVINRYHMLDLADALKVEQNIRWGALFFTKHRLYWTWLLQTMRARPQLAVAVGDLEKGFNELQKRFPDQTPGTFTFQVPWQIPGMIGPGMNGKGMEITIPVARLLWLTEASNNPGALSNAMHAISTSSSPISALMPGRGSVDFTTIDSSINQLYLRIQHGLGNIKTSKGVIDSMSPDDQIRFEGIIARVQAGYYAQHHRYLDDNRVTDIALQHMMITSFWRSTAFTGAYANDPRLSSAQDKAWKRYNESPNPGERERIRAANPWMNQLLGAYTAPPHDKIVQDQLWADFNRINKAHEAAQSALLVDAKTNPERVGYDLFGKAWRQTGADYAKAINALEKKAKSQGSAGHDWVTQFNSDHYAQVHKLLASQLHEMYGTPMNVAEKVARGGRPSWVTTYRNMLYGKGAPLSDAVINSLPVDEQTDARITASTFKKMIAPFSSEPTTKVELIRDQYFKQAYTPWADQRNKFFQKANTEDKQDQGRVFDAMRAWYDRQDKPVTINGMEFPSPIRVHFAMLPKAAQQQYRQGLMTKQWGWLSAFDKHLLGTDVPQSVQDGWTAYNNGLYEFISGPQGTIHKAGVHPQVSPIQALAYAKIIDQTHKGFFADYSRGLQPAYVSLGQQHLGGTPNAQATWKTFLGKVTQFANWAGGAYPTDPAKLAVRDSLFNKQLWTDLLETGRQGVLNGYPLARPPDNEYPQGGYFYQFAMAQSDETFKKEFRAWVKSDPDFLYKLWQPGG